MLIASLVVIYLIICALMYVKQRSFLYFPVSEIQTNTATRYFEVNDQRIKVWLLHPDKEKAIIYFGGNAENVAQNIDTFTHLFPEYAVYLVNYRGYAGSSGTPSEQALFLDATAIFDELRTKHSQISAIGRSLGSGVAVHLAVERKLEKIVLVTPYDSIASVAQKRFFWLPVSLLLKDHFDSKTRASKLNIPTLILSSEHDNVIPFRHTQALINAIDDLYLHSEKILGTSHNNIEQGEGYYSRLQNFMNEPVLNSN